jgi:hypothetical protein
MKSLSKISIALLLMAFVASSCGKYEEGPMISLLPKTMRITSQWKMDKYFENGVEQTLTADQKDDYLDIKDDGILDVVYVVGSSSTTATGTWELSSSKELLTFKYTYSIFTVNDEYTILRLTTKELWLEKVDGTVTEEYHYIQR